MSVKNHFLNFNSSSQFNSFFCINLLTTVKFTEVNTELRLQQLIKALEAEKEFEKQMEASLLTESSRKERILKGVTLYPVQLDSIGFSAFQDLTLKFNIPEHQHSRAFVPGRQLQVFNNDGKSANAVVSDSKKKWITIYSNDSSIEEWVKNGQIGLHLIPDSKTTELLLSELKQIEEHSVPKLVKTYYSEIETEAFHLPFTLNPNLNTSQNKAVESAAKQNVCIIHGPPGTGKTTTLIQVVQDLVKNGKSVRLAASNNAAVDYLVKLLAEKGIKVLRLGNPIKMDDSVWPFTLDEQAKKDVTFKYVLNLKKQADKLQKEIQTYKRNFGKEEYQARKANRKEWKAILSEIKSYKNQLYQSVIRQSEVICGTFYALLNESNLSESYDVLVVDEAAQAIEPPIWALSKNANQLILAGDHQQLPATIQSPKAESLGLGQSAIEMADKSHFKLYLLDTQYRMNEQIVGFSNAQFYHGLLKTDVSVKNQHINDGFEALEFIDTAGCAYDEIKENESLSNPDEVTLVKKRVDELITFTTQIGVISPYRSQVDLLEDVFESIEAIEVNTIDSFQGQEKEVIIISLVRSNETANIGFLSDYRRMNVAMTRAKKKLIVIGDSSTIGLDDFYSKWLEFVEQNGSYRSAWEYMD